MILHAVYIIYDLMYIYIRNNPNQDTALRDHFTS
jgi:hypothetical protein